MIRISDGDQVYMCADSEFERPLARTFWSAFFDGFSIAGIRSKLRIPHSAELLFQEDSTLLDLATASDQALKNAFVQLDPEALNRVKEAVHEAEIAHTR